MRSDTPLFRLRHSIYGLANKIWGNERERENESPGNEAAMLLNLSLDSLGAGPDRASCFLQPLDILTTAPQVEAKWVRAAAHALLVLLPCRFLSRM